MKKIICLITLILLFGAIGIKAQQSGESNQTNFKPEQSQFKKLFDKKDVIVTTEKYELEDYKDDLKVSAGVGWTDETKEKIYAANFGSIYVDYKQLDKLRDDIEKIIERIENSYSEDKIISIRYISPDGIFINYYNWKANDGTIFKNVYFKYEGFLSQDKTTATIRKFSDSIAKVKEKLIALGAERQNIISKK